MDRREFTKLLGLSGIATGLPSLGLAWPPATPADLATRVARARQAFMDMRFGMFIHLNMATYEQREWGDPTVSPSVFNPKALDARQWAHAARSANMGYGCLTTKHHDGFCLWPTKTASANVAQSPYKGDIVRQYVDAFRAEGLKPCLYFSMLDLRADIRPDVMTPAKISMIKAQLTELLTHYGPIPALIFDGWNASWARIGYDQLPFRDIYDLVKQLQPDCLVTDHNAGQYPGTALYYSDIKQYEQHAGQKIPAGNPIPSQSGTTLQSDWFWKEDYPTQALRPARQIVDEWLRPFNDNHCNLILNCAPNRDGLFDDNARKRLAEIGGLWHNPGPAPRLSPCIWITTPNLARHQPSYASSIADASGPDLAFDDSFGTYWEADAGKSTAWLELRPSAPLRFNTIALVEPRDQPDYGKAGRLRSYVLEVRDHNDWTTVARGPVTQAITLFRVKATQASHIRLTLQSIGGAPGLSEFGLYMEPSSAPG